MYIPFFRSLGYRKEQVRKSLRQNDLKFLKKDPFRLLR